MSSRRVVECLCAVVFFVSSGADALVIDVKVKVDGAVRSIGSLAGSVTPSGGGFEHYGLFTFDPAYSYLDDCYDFRWFQTIWYDNCPAQYKGNDLPPAGVPSKDAVDPPLDGWDYQRTPANNYTTGTPGADKSPFYENDDNGNTYAYPNFAARHTEGVDSWTDDFPGICDGYDVKTVWNTFLVVTGGNIPANQFGILAGYEWRVGRNNVNDGTGQGTKYGSTGGTVIFGDAALVNTILAGSGFTTWSALLNPDLDLTCIPEPATLVLMASLLLVRRHRDRGRYAE